MERSLDKRESYYHRHGTTGSDHHHDADTTMFNHRRRNSNNNRFDHEIRRNSSRSMEPQQHLLCTASELPVGRQHTGTQHQHQQQKREYDRFNTHYVKRNEHDIEKEQYYRHGSHHEDRQPRESMIGGNHVNGATGNYSPPHHDDQHHQNHRYRRSSSSVTSDPLPSHTNTLTPRHHHNSLSQRWSQPSFKQEKKNYDVSYHQRHASNPVEIVSTIHNAHHVPSPDLHCDNGHHDQLDGSSSPLTAVVHAPNVVDMDACDNTTSARSTRSLRKPRDANPQEDSSSLSPKLSPPTLVRPTATTRDLATNQFPDESLLQLPLIHKSTQQDALSVESLPELQSSGDIDHTLVHTQRDLSTNDTGKSSPPVLCDELEHHMAPPPRHAIDLSQVTVGTRTAIYWENEGQYFSGTVTKMMPLRKKPYHVKYDDGDQEWINFNHERFYIIDELDEKSSFVTKQISDETLAADQTTSSESIPRGHTDVDWVAAGMIQNDSDSDTDDEELTQWAVKMLGVPAPCEVKSVLPNQLVPASMNYYNIPMSISEKVKLGRRNRSMSTTVVEPLPAKKHKSTTRRLNISKQSKTSTDAEMEAEAKRRKQQARPLTAAEIRSILSEDDHPLDGAMSSSSLTYGSWVRRSVRQPSKSSLNAPRVKELLEKLVCNDSDMIVLKMKKYCSDLDTPSIVIDAVLDALEDNTNCEALYIQV